MFFKTKKDFYLAVDEKVRKEMDRYDHDRYVDGRIVGLENKLGELQTRVYVLETKIARQEKKPGAGEFNA